MAKFSRELQKADTRLPLSFMRHLNTSVVQECHVQWCSHSSQLVAKCPDRLGTRRHTATQGDVARIEVVVKPGVTLLCVAT